MMSGDISRRNFLKGGAAAAAGLAAGSVVLPQAVQASTGGEFCTLLDIEKCVGCEECVEACRDKWQDTVPDPVNPIPKPFPSRVPIQDWSNKKDVQDRLTPYNFLYIDMLAVEYKGEEREINIPRRCMHCTNPPCTNLCPFGAGRVEKNGVVHIDPDVCLGGSKCKTVCPWNIPQRQSGVGIYLDLLPSLAGNGVMFKCHRCLPLVAKGETPRCIEVCPEKVQSIGTRGEMLKKAEALAREKAKADGAPESDWKKYIYGLEENGGTNTLYVSPIPFAEISKAMEKQHAGQRAANQPKKKGAKKIRGDQGLPHMKPVGATMASAENLTYALAIAPVAGLAAGLGKLFSKAKKALPPDEPGDSAGQGGRS